MSEEARRISFDWGLYAIVDPEHCGAWGLLELARMLLQGGAGVLQLRDKRGAFEDQARTARSLRSLCNEYDVPFLVNDNPYLAKEIGADGVHLGQEDMPVSFARDILGPDRIIGLSTHTRAQARAGENSGADYLGFGPAFATSTKTQIYKPLGAPEMKWAVETLRKPFVAIGGITLENVGRLVEVGVKNVATITALSRASNPVDAAAAFALSMNRRPVDVGSEEG